uniref:Sec-independent protein translocase component TatC n=1 Tax=Aurantiochytrium acetophilum TaxID=2172886 RepID=A0A481XI78_9STRA|nr:Sec-independent protein translocase component TatC [Aurantiochytrium acetophilum]
MIYKFFIQDLVYRLFYVILSFIITSFVIFFKKSNLLYIVTISIDSYRFIILSPFELFNTDVIFSFYFGFFVSLVVFLIQAYCFFIPALYLHEQRLVRFLLLCFLSLYFFAGISCFAYFLPKLWCFFIQFSIATSFFSIDFIFNYSFFIRFIILLHFGMVFMFSFFPVLLSILFGFTSFRSSFVFYNRRYFYVMFSICGGILSPPDLLTQVIIFVVLSMFFEAVLLLICFFKNFKVLFNAFS